MRRTDSVRSSAAAGSPLRAGEADAVGVGDAAGARPHLEFQGGEERARLASVRVAPPGQADSTITVRYFAISDAASSPFLARSSSLTLGGPACGSSIGTPDRKSVV